MAMRVAQLDMLRNLEDFGKPLKRVTMVGWWKAVQRKDKNTFCAQSC